MVTESLLEKSRQPVAIVIGLDINGLGVARSLSRRRVPVLALHDRSDSPYRLTRHARFRRVESLSGRSLVKQIQQLSDRARERPVLFPTEERTVETLVRHHKDLASCCRYKLPDGQLLERLTSKSGFDALAKKHGFLVPGTWTVDRSTYEDVSAVEFPCIVKPSVKNDAYARHCRKAYFVHDREELARVFEEVFPHVDEVVVQEWVPGGDEEIRFCLFYCSRPGHMDAAFVGRKLYSWPPGTGGTASCMPELDGDVIEAVRSETERFVAAIGLVGMGSMEFKRHAVNGRFYMIEPTIGRTDYQEEVAALNGVNLPWAMYADLVKGEIPEQKRTRRVRIWRDRHMPRWSAERQGRQCHVSPGSGVDSVWRWSDPLPGLYEGYRRLTKRLGRIRIGNVAGQA